MIEVQIFKYTVTLAIAFVIALFVSQLVEVVFRVPVAVIVGCTITRVLDILVAHYWK